MASTCFQHKSSEYDVQSSRVPTLKDASDDDGLPSISEILEEVRQRPRRPVIDLTLESDSDDGEPLPTSSSPTQSTQKSPPLCSAAASQAMKNPFKNRPSWSPYLQKGHRSSLEPPSETSQNALHANTESAESVLTVSEPAPEHAKGLIGQSGGSPEILETPTEENSSDDGSGLSLLNGTEPSICETAQECDAGPMKATKRQRMDQTDTVLDTSCSHESPACVAECSGQTLTSELPSSLLSRIDDTLARVIISTFMIAKITDERLGRFQCEFEPLWLPADVVKMVPMGDALIRRYEENKSIIPAGGLRTLGGRKRQRSQM